MKRKIYLYFLVVGTMLIQSCKTNDVQPVNAKTFVLVHGAWQGPYVWQYVKRTLESKGHAVVVVELPAHGTDSTSAGAVTMNSYRDKVIGAVQATKAKVILVGHSLGGMVVSAAAESIPGNIEKLIYIAGFVPVSGQRLIDLAAQDAQSLLGASLVPSADQLTLDVVQQNRISIFCEDGSAEAKKLLTDNFRVEPAFPFGMPVTLTEKSFGKVDKYYIHTRADQAIGLVLQKQMAQNAGIGKTYSLDSGHSPFLSMPDSVTTILLNIIK